MVFFLNILGKSYFFGPTFSEVVISLIGFVFFLFIIDFFLPKIKRKEISKNQFRPLYQTTDVLFQPRVDNKVPYFPIKNNNSMFVRILIVFVAVAFVLFPLSL